MKGVVSILLLTTLFGCASNGKYAGNPMCQGFHDKGQFDLWAQCSQSVRNIESSIVDRIIARR